jgi:hypothetical protein
MSNARISALGSVSFGWLHQQGGFVFDEPFFLEPRKRLETERRIHAFVAKRFPFFPVYNIEAHLVQVAGRQRPVILVGGLQPNLILGAAVGAEFVFYGDKDPDITPTPLADRPNLDGLRDLDWASMWPVSAFLEQVRSAREEWGSEFAIIPPFFWDTTGRATVHGIVTTAQKLVGERLFLEMADGSPFVRELFQWIADSYATLIHLFADAAGMPITGLHVGDCSLCMVGPGPFKELVLPPLNELIRRTGPVRLHSCGFSNHLLDAFRGVEHLAALNVGSGTSVAKIRERFKSIPVDLLPPVELVTTGTPEAMDEWVRRSVEENGEGELELQYHLDLGQPEETCFQIHRTLDSLGYSDRRMTIH